MNIKELEKIHNPENRVWRNKLTWRSTSTGMNKNVINTYAPYNRKEEVVKHMRTTLTPYTDGRKYLDRKGNDYNQYFIDVVNDCMLCVFSGMKGYVFTELQLREVIMLFPSVKITYNENDGCYWCWR